MSDGWRNVTRDRPCLVCGKLDWCRRSFDGCYECHRQSGDVAGLRLLKVTQSGFGLYRADGDGQATPPRKHAGSGKPKAPRVYAALPEAVSIVRRAMGAKVAGQWAYNAADGTHRFTVVRYDLPDRTKQFRLFHNNGTGWVCGDPQGLLPLNGLPELLASTGRVYVVEGEKCVDAARSIGLTATTSAHGSKSAHKTDWTPLAGREVVVLPDNDSAGDHYARDVAGMLAGLDSPAEVKIVHLPNLPPGGDIVDYIERRDSTEIDDIRRSIEGLADATPVHVCNPPTEQAASKAPVPKVIPWRPFPVEVLPEPVRGFVAEGARAIGCDPAYLALPTLAMLAAAIGTTRGIKLKRSWCEPSVFWAVIIGRSGTLKSPALDLALRPLHKRQARALQEHAERMKQHDRDRVEYQAALGEWRKRGYKGGEPQPDKPEEPTANRSICADTTIEALATLLESNARGLLLARDELSGWLASFDAYKSTHGADTAHWLELHRAGQLIVDRKTGAKRTVYVPRAAASVTGTIQPRTFREAIGTEHRDNGLAARLLLAQPPVRRKRWTEADIDPRTEDRVAAVVDSLLAIEYATDENGEPTSIDVPLSRDGKTAWVRFYNEHAVREADAESDDLAAAFSKVEGYAARLALVFHLVRRAAGDPTLADGDAIDAASIEAGAELARWFCHEAERLYASFAESDEDRERRGLVEWIGRRGGSVTAREFQQGHRQYRTAEDARSALQCLVEAGLGRWILEQPGKKGGRPSDCFQLTQCVYVYETSRSDTENEGSVGVDGVDGTANASGAADDGGSV